MIKILKEKIDILHYVELLKKDDAGAVVTFLGEPRKSIEDGDVISINYTAYEAMALSEMKKIEQEALNISGIKEVIIIHRIGEVLLQEVSLFVGISSAHREEGFKVCSMVVDKVKEKVPIWKEIKNARSGDS
ncbi:MAG: molybdenum cofactor biosynthesis protein MoaE [Caldisericaceae bacterium]|nr:molybdenum cofactor biosynthesis protein MoaE [Caldisericaceae bacterium]